MKMFLNYLSYIIRHKWYVMIECFKRGLIWRGLVHDLSKFLPDEFFPYMFWFYGKWGVKIENRKDIKNRHIRRHKKCLQRFNMAWLKHQHRNKHHYQYWYLRFDNGNEEYLEMPNKYIKEMLCDWIGAGKAITGKNNIKEWYEKTKQYKIMGNINVVKIERLINENT